MRKLTAKQQMFVKEYLVDLNATQAAIRAGYSARTADVIGVENLGKPRIADEIQKAMKERSSRVEITADMVLKELASIGFAKTTDAISIVNGTAVVAENEDLTEDTQRAISEIRQTTTVNGGSIAIKFHDKKGALELIGRHIGMWNDKLIISNEEKFVDVFSKLIESLPQ